MTAINPSKSPTVGILMLETGFPRIPGDVGNPATFSFPVCYHVVKGASPQRVVKDADHGLLAPFLDAARALERRGVRAIATSCGFLAIFQRQLADAVHVPVFGSSLLQIGLAQRVIRHDQTVGIITADRDSLTAAHFAGVGISSVPPAIIGMPPGGEFATVFLGGKKDLDITRCRQEMRTAAADLLRRHPDTGSIILECTNMPPYAADIQQTTGLPVFDVVSLIRMAHCTTAPSAFPLPSA